MQSILDLRSLNGLLNNKILDNSNRHLLHRCDTYYKDDIKETQTKKSHDLIIHQLQFIQYSMIFELHTSVMMNQQTPQN